MDTKQILAGLRQGLEVVDKLAPLAALLGPQGAAVGKIVEGLTEVGQTVLERAQEGAVVLTSEDQDEIRSINHRLAAKNDELAQRIADS